MNADPYSAPTLDNGTSILGLVIFEPLIIGQTSNESSFGIFSVVSGGKVDVSTPANRANVSYQSQILNI